MSFSYSIAAENGKTIISLSGQLIDKYAAEGLLAEYDSLIAAGTNEFVLDLSDLAYLNSSGLNVLISMLTKARKADGELSISSLSDKVRELFVITKLNAVFPIVDNPAPTTGQLPVS